ncbi:uncharacterized protein TNCT_230271 [Trichonephila clavata]|uniref:Uncharacterized protein n=1 Tax=Trichonephila clavata TaxID=2740835 RepID=A0A8X6LYH1_TRICU|nr:uncharacterized protein TNCT_230271 [Trichonephila clavata]
MNSTHSDLDNTRRGVNNLRGSDRLRHWRPTEIPELRASAGFRVLPELFFSGKENVSEIISNIDDNIAYYEIPANLACAYLKGHLIGRALDWFEVIGFEYVNEEATAFATLKKKLSDSFHVVRNKSELEAQFFSSKQRRGQAPSDFICQLLKIHKALNLNYDEIKLVDHIVMRLEPQIMDYLEVRNPTTKAQLIELVDRYEERHNCRENQGSSNNFARRGWDMSRNPEERRNNGNCRDTGVGNRQNDQRGLSRGENNFSRHNYQNQGFEGGNRYNHPNQRTDRYQNRRIVVRKGPSDDSAKQNWRVLIATAEGREMPI